MQDHMTDAEKIEALRKWAETADRPSLNDFYLIAVRQVRDIIDPPVMCTCGEQDVRGRTVQIDYTLHAKDWCGPCCTHGIDRRIECEQCLPPKWREMVDDYAPLYGHSYHAMSNVLKSLSFIADPLCSEEDVAHNLARTVALCEAQVGDGWQADPDEWWGDTVTMHGLLERLACLEYEFADWQGLGHAAAAWLRSLTDGGAA